MNDVTLDPRAGAPYIPALAAGLIPALAVAAKVSSALWISAVMLAALLGASLVAALAARRLPGGPGAFAALLAAAVIVAGLEMLAAAFLPAVRADLGIYLPVTAVNALVLGRAADALADRVPESRARRAAGSALLAGLAFLAVLVPVAVIREALGAGTITLPTGAGEISFRVPGFSEAPARGLLLPFGGLIAAGYLAGLVNLLARRAGRPGPRGGAA